MPGPMLHLQVWGEPATQGSHNAGRRGQVYDKNKKLPAWRDAVTAAALAHCFADRAVGGWRHGPLMVIVRFRLQRPPSHYRRGRNAHLLASDAPAYPATRPDLDKMLRATLDALKLGFAYHDDGQVCAVTAVKAYADGAKPGAEIVIAPWPGEEARRADDPPSV